MLATVTDVGPLRADDLADLFGVDKSSIRRQVRRVEQARFLHRRVDPTDLARLLHCLNEALD